MVGWAFGFGVGGLGLVGRGLCGKLWRWWVGIGQVCAFGFGVGGLGLVSGGVVLAVCMVGWVEVGRWWRCCALVGLGLGGCGMVGRWVCA